jgi:hypothetical protein
MTDENDLNPVALVRDVAGAEERLAQTYGADTVDVDITGGEATLRLEFRGAFSGLEHTMDHLSEIVRRLDGLEDVSGVHAGVNTDGAYDPEEGEETSETLVWANATIEL